jgi:hypothetical protein
MTRDSRTYNPLRRGVSIAAVCVLTLAGIGSPDARAQEALPLPSLVRAGGSAGFMTQGYSASGIAGRRAPTSGQVFANTSFNVMGFQSGFSLLYSTEQSRLQTSANRISFSARNSFLQVGAGDVSPNYSKYSISGTTVRGALVQATWRDLVVGVSGGKSRRAATGSDEDAIAGAGYSRTLVAGRVGYGKPRRRFVGVSVLYGEDQPNELSLQRFGPAYNVSVSPEVAWAGFNGMLSVQGHLTGSVVTPDGRGPAAERDLLIPLGLIPVRAGTFSDYAGEVDVRFSMNPVGVNVGFSRIQPGFESFGLPYMRNDQQTIRIQPRIALLSQRVQLGLQYSNTRNNLLDQLNSTMSRNQAGLSVQARVTDQLSVAANLSMLDNRNEPATSVADPVLLHQQQVSSVMMIAPNLVVQRGAIMHNVSVALSHQSSDDRSMAVRQGLRRGIEIANTAVMTSYSLQFQSGLNLSTSANYVQSEATSTEAKVLDFRLGAGHTLMNRKLNLNASGGWSRNDISSEREGVSLENGSTILTSSLSAGYRVRPKDMVQFQLRAMSSSPDSGSGFREMQASLRYEHRF